MGDEAGCGGGVGEGVADAGVEGVGEEGEVEGGDVGVGDDNVGGGGEVCEDGACDVVVEVESAVDRVSAEDGTWDMTEYFHQAYYIFIVKQMVPM